MSALMSFAMALFLTTVTMPLMIRHAGRLGLMDEATADRKVHEQAVPRSGGIAIVIGVTLAAWWWIPKEQVYLPLAFTAFLVAITGYLDDRFDFSSLQKVLGQCVAGALFLVAYGAFPQLPFFALDAAPGWLALAWTFAFLVGITNAVNLSDGLDGLAAGNSLLSIGLLAALAMLSDRVDYVLFALALAGGLLGFLRFNTHPARLFMGDTGSQFLGYAAAALTVLIFQSESTPMSPMLPILAFGLPILDTLTVITIRGVRGRPLFSADRSHLHHQLLGLGFKHYEVVALLYALQACIVLVAYRWRAESDLALLLTYLGFCGAVLGGIFLGRQTGWRAHAGEDQKPSKERRNLWLRKFSWFQAHSAKLLGGLVGLFFMGGAMQHTLQSQLLAGIAFATAATLVAVMFWFRDRSVPISRAATYIAAAFSIYVFVQHPEARPALTQAVDLFVVFLAVAVALAIRLTRSSQFHLDTQDYLVFFLLVAIMLLPFEQVDKQFLGRVLLYAGVLLYACEFVVSKGNGSRRILSWAGVASLVVLGTRM